MLTIHRCIGLLRFLAVPLLLLIAQQSAHADLWAFVDPRGVTHFAAEQADARYELFFRGSQFDSSRDAPASDQRPGQAQPPAVRLLAFFDISPDYKRVKHHLRASASRQGVDYELLQAGMYMSRMIRSGWKSASTVIACRGSVRVWVRIPALLSTRSVWVAWARESSTISTL